MKANNKIRYPWIALAMMLGCRILGCSPQPALANWEKPAQPPASGTLAALLAHPFEDGKIIAADGRQLFSKTGTGAWRPFAHEPGGKIQKLLYLTETPRDFFILTEKNISRCDFETVRCSEIYRSSKIRGENILSFAIDPEDREHWFLGTEKGLFESDDAGKTWFGFGNLKKPVSLLRFWKGHFFLAAGGTLYGSDRKSVV